jgi:hypothetical protein
LIKLSPAKKSEHPFLPLKGEIKEGVALPLEDKNKGHPISADTGTKAFAAEAPRGLAWGGGNSGCCRRKNSD